jgi:hypothetical protein
VRRALPTVLSIAAGGLLTTLAWQVGALTSAPVMPVPRPLAPVAVGAAAAAPNHTDEWFDTILARPLFSRDRRPDSGEVAARRDSAALPRLSGVMVGPFGRSAIFAIAGGKPLLVKEGDRVDGWTVETIEAGTVHITGPGGPRALHPSFVRNSADGPATPAGVPGQRVGLAVSD